MAEPKIKRINTIAIRFSDGERNRDTAKVLLRDILDIKSSSIACVGNEGGNSIHVKFKSAVIYNFICENYHGQFVDVDNIRVKIIDVSTYTTKVTMRNIPLEFTNAQLERILLSYGTLKDNIIIQVNKDDYFEDVPSMERIAYMSKIHSPIPNTLFVNLIGTCIYFSYHGQTPTCNRCGNKDHAASQCPVADRKNRNFYRRPENRENAFTLSYDEEFPPMNTARKSSPDVSTDPGLSEALNGPTDAHATTPSAANVGEVEPEVAQETTSLIENVLITESNKTSITPTLENNIDAQVTNNDTLDNKLNPKLTQEKNPNNENTKSHTSTEMSVSNQNNITENNIGNILSPKADQVVWPAHEHRSSARLHLQNT